MATLNPFTIVSNPVPSGGVGTTSLTFATNPGTPDVTADVTVCLDGVVQQAATGIVLKGRPAEATPTVSIGTTNQGWEVRTSKGTLSSLGNNVFAITY